MARNKIGDIFTGGGSKAGLSVNTLEGGAGRSQGQILPGVGGKVILNGREYLEADGFLIPQFTKNLTAAESAIYNRFLKDHYTDESKVDALLELGNISSLNKNIGEKHDFNDHELQRENKWTVAYGRDRDESDTEARIVSDITELTQSGNWTEYHYVYDNGKWRCWGSNGREIIF